ncbi:response regulator [Paenibacillus sp. GCM10027626]|uniref:response regulator n=1 Tax=Paenibacillus sp. GCM10027626 TaxID=3273411 RepID=UPI003632D5E2
MKVVIAEDEMFVRIGMKNSINWEKYGMKVIADVANGEEAWDVYLKEKPDIILTDIKMPLMDGMELIGKIRENDKKTKIVVLTVHEEFNYVHKALQLGVTDYILKLKMTMNEIEAVLGKVKAELEAEAAENESDNRRHNSLEIDLPRKKEAVVKDYLFYQTYSEKQFSDIAGRLGLRLSPEGLVMCLASIRDYERIERRFHDKHGSLIRFSVLNILDEVLQGVGRGEVIHEKDDRYLLLFSFPETGDERQIRDQLQNILNHANVVMRTYLNTTLTFAISEQYDGYGKLGAMYVQCEETLEYRYFAGAAPMIYWKELQGCDIRRKTLKKLQMMLKEIEVASPDYNKEIDRRIHELAETEITRNELTLAFVRWVHWPAIHLQDYRLSEVSRLAFEYTEQIQRHATLEETIDCFKRYVSLVNECLYGMKALTREVAEAAAFVRTHYREEFSLQEIADHVHMSPNYLSSLFKKELRFSLVEYMNRIRVDKAKQLLRDTPMKSYEVALEVGYADESYFSRMFKRYCGMAPNEYRKSRFVENRSEDGRVYDQNVPRN